MDGAAASAERAAALAAFAPERFGFRPDRAGWLKDVPGLGPVAVVPLAWQHAHAASYDEVNGERVETDALGLIVGLQGRTWGMPPGDLVPSNLLAVVADTGGSVLVAYDFAKGCNVDGWLGFAIAVGARSGTLVSHMVGVREEARGNWDIGWYLKVIQGYEALRTDHRAAIWTFDPMRGANARLNLEKLGGGRRRVHDRQVRRAAERSLRRRAKRPPDRALGPAVASDGAANRPGLRRTVPRSRAGRRLGGAGGDSTFVGRAGRGPRPGSAIASRSTSTG